MNIDQSGPVKSISPEDLRKEKDKEFISKVKSLLKHDN